MVMLRRESKLVRRISTILTLMDKMCELCRIENIKLNKMQ